MIIDIKVNFQKKFFIIFFRQLELLFLLQLIFHLFLLEWKTGENEKVRVLLVMKKYTSSNRNCNCYDDLGSGKIKNIFHRAMKIIVKMFLLWDLIAEKMF